MLRVFGRLYSLMSFVVNPVSMLIELCYTLLHLYLTQIGNRLSSTKGGKREIDHLCMTSQLSNIKGKSEFPHIS